MGIQPRLPAVKSRRETQQKEIIAAVLSTLFGLVGAIPDQLPIVFSLFTLSSGCLIWLSRIYYRKTFERLSSAAAILMLFAVVSLSKWVGYEKDQGDRNELKSRAVQTQLELTKTKNLLGNQDIKIQALTAELRKESKASLVLFLKKQSLSGDSPYSAQVLPFDRKLFSSLQVEVNLFNTKPKWAAVARFLYGDPYRVDEYNTEYVVRYRAVDGEFVDGLRSNFASYAGYGLRVILAKKPSVDLETVLPRISQITAQVQTTSGIRTRTRCILKPRLPKEKYLKFVGLIKKWKS
jgi:hypothetical protein